MAGANASLLIIDLSDPVSPRWLGTLANRGAATSREVVSPQKQTLKTLPTFDDERLRNGLVICHPRRSATCA